MSYSLAKDETLDEGIADKYQQKNQKFEGFDFLRAIFAIAIVADHTGLFTLATVGEVDIATNILYANFSYVAVPVFFQISLFLFYFKCEKVDFKSFLKKRIIRLSLLYFFWLVSFTFLKTIFETETTKTTNPLSLSPWKFMEFIVSGGNSPLYFFFSLIFLTALAAICHCLLKKLERQSTRIKISYLLFFTSCILLLCFSIIEPIVNSYIDTQIIALIQTISNISRWNYNPLNFLPYIFTTYITAQEFDQGKLNSLSPKLKIKLWTLFFLFLLFTILEWVTLDSLINYSRLSLVFGSWLLLYLSLLSSLKVPAIVSFISDCSLGIYCFHLFFTHILFIQNKFDIAPKLDLLVKFLLVLGVSIALTFILKKIKGVKYVV